MPVRSSMAALIARMRLLINDPAGASQVFADQDIQDILDASRQDMQYLDLAAYPTYSGSTIQFLDYYADWGDWEDDATFWQYRITQVTPSVREPIVGHWTFAQTTLPPVFLLGKTYDVYRAAADLLDRQAAKWVLRYSASVDGQNLQRGQVTTALQALAKTYRMKQRPSSSNFIMSNFTGGTGGFAAPSLGPTELDRMGSG